MAEIQISQRLADLIVAIRDAEKEGSVTNVMMAEALEELSRCIKEPENLIKELMVQEINDSKTMIPSSNAVRMAIQNVHPIVDSSQFRQYVQTNFNILKGTLTPALLRIFKGGNNVGNALVSGDASTNRVNIILFTAHNILEADADASIAETTQTTDGTVGIYSCVVVSSGAGYSWTPWVKVSVGSEESPLFKSLNLLLNSFEAVKSPNLFDKSTITKGYFDMVSKEFRLSDNYWTSDYIEVEEGKEYQKFGSRVNFIVYLYDENKDWVTYENEFYLYPERDDPFEIPKGYGIKYVRIVFRPDTIDTLMFGLSSDIQALNGAYEPFWERLMLKSGRCTDVTKSMEAGVSQFADSLPTGGAADMGCLECAGIGDWDYSQVIIYGQSLGMGWQADNAITTKALPYCFMVGNSPLISKGNTGEGLEPLVASKWSYASDTQKGGEQPVVAATNVLAWLYNRTFGRNQLFIGSTAGDGGMSIERLSKECTNGTNYYNTTFLSLLDKTKKAVESLGKSVGCCAIVFMQGEYNYSSLSGAGLTTGTDATNDKDVYKEYLKKLKENMQSDIMAKYGQNEKPLFFIYQTAGAYINLKEMPITLAQIEFAAENEDVVLISSTYFTPDYGGAHLSTNGYRWYGEMIGKHLYKALVKREFFGPVSPESFEFDDSTVRIGFKVPYPPLMLDNWTKEQCEANGFAVYVDGVKVTIEKVTAMGTFIELRCSKPLTGEVEVIYAGKDSKGSGNLCDSDPWKSMYLVYDDRAEENNSTENYAPRDREGNLLYGKRYPMQNWCSHFYRKFSIMK